MESFECDVVVIGAGLSGLTAAYFLTSKDHSLRVIVLEAKDRIGGRTLTRQLTAADGSKDFWDIGGEWIGRPQPHMHYLLQKFGIHTFSILSSHYRDQGDNKGVEIKWQTRLDLQHLVWKLDRLKSKITRDGVKGSSLAADFDSVLFSTYLEENAWTQDAKTLIESACKCMFSISSTEMSLLFFLMFINAAGGLQTLLSPKEYAGGECRIKGGAQQLCHHLVQKVGKRFVYLKQPVIEITQSIEGARVMTNTMQVLCQRVIMAIPPHHTANIAYQPALPKAKKGLLQSVPLAYLVKFIITYDEAFWTKINNRRQPRFQVVLSLAGMPVGVAYDAVSCRGNPAIAGFVSSSVTMDRDVKERRTAILRLLEPHLGSECHRLLDFSQLDWSQEPYNGGCFLKALSSGLATYKSDLRQPFDRIHFAGTETASVWCGFMNGAVQSGFRAATEVLYHLRPLIVSSPDLDACPFEDDGVSLHKNDAKRSHVHLWWLLWGAGCVGLLSAAFFLTRGSSISPSNGLMAGPGTFVKNIRLVFESP